jgi:TalC/MipB family fructose-6-phosphate aldolase
MKQLFLDSANIDEIKSVLATDAIRGVTTNPSLMAKEVKGGYTQRLQDICQLFDDISTAKKHLSVEVITLDPSKMYDQAMMLQDILGGHKNVDLHIKIPVLFETLHVISKLSDKQVNVNATACMTMEQAKIAHDAGATVISFFYNRMLDGVVDAELEIGRFCNKMLELNIKSRVICGSIRKSGDPWKCWLAGADIVTVSMKVLKDMIRHPQTDRAVKQFQEDIEKWLA